MAVAAGVVSVVGGVAQSVIGARQAKKAREAIKNYKRQELKNAYSDLDVSTLSADLQREELARVSASSIQALRSGGVRGVIGGVGSVQESNVLQSRAIGADLDRQQQQIDQLRASDEVRIQQMQERREEEDLRGLGQQLATGQQNVMGGISTAAAGVGALAGLGGQAQTNPTVTPVQTPSFGIAPVGGGGPVAGEMAPQNLGMLARGYAPVGYSRPQAPLYLGD